MHEGSSTNSYSGKNVIYGEAYDVSDSSRLSMAIRNEEIIPYFQPIVNINEDVCGVEVLARWPQGIIMLFLSVSLYRWLKKWLNE